MASRWNQQEQGAKRRRTNQGTRGTARTQPAASNPNKNRKSTDTNRNIGRPAAAKPAPKAAPKAAPKQTKPSGVQKVQQKVTYFTNKNKPKQTTQQTSLNRLARQKGTAQVLTGKQTPLPPKRATRMGQTLNPMEQLKTDAKLGRENWISRATVPAKPLTAEQQKKKNQQTAKQSGFNARARKQTLSSYDQKLAQGKQFQIQQAKQRFDEAKAKGDSAGMAKAHREAESLRYGSGYSGGATGSEYITANLTQDDYNRLNADGQKAMKQARLTRSRAVTEEEIARADRRIEEILNAPGYRNNRLSAAETGKGWSYGPDGRRMWAGTKEQNREDARPAIAGLQGIGKRIVGQYAHFGQSVARANRDIIDRNNINKWIVDADNYIQAQSDLERYDSFVAQFGAPPDDLPANRNVLVMRLNDAIQARAQLARIEHDVDSPYYDETHAKTARELMRERYSLPGRDEFESPVSMMLNDTPTGRKETFGERMLREGAELEEEALEGTTGLNRVLGQTALMLGDMAPKAALAAIPGVGPLLSTYAFGAGITGETAYNLRQQGATNSQALFQGALEGGAVLGLGALSGAATSGAARFLASKGLQNNAVAKAAMASVSGGAFAAGGTGMRVLANKFGYGEKDNLTAGQLVQDAVIDFAFGAIFTLLSGGPKKMASRREESASWEFFSKDMSPEEARALYRRYAKQYHPDVGGDGAVFARISDEYARYKQEVVNRAQTSYRAATKASAEGKADVAAQAEAEYREAVGAIQATMEEEIAARPEIAEAMEILGAVSRDGIKAPDLDPAQVSGIMQRPQEPTNVAALPPAAATERSPLTMTAQEMAENDHRTPMEKAQDQGQSALELAARALQARNEARELAAQQAAAWAARPREEAPVTVPEPPTTTGISPTLEERPVETTPKTGSIEAVEKEKTRLRGAIKMPVKGTNAEALEAGARSGELSLDSVTFGGNVPGFTKAQRNSFAEQVIEAAGTDARTIDVDVPGDGDFHMENTPENVANVLNKLNVKANQESIFTKPLDKLFSDAVKTATFTLNGEHYVTNGALALAVGEPGAKYAAENYKAAPLDMKQAEFANEIAKNDKVLTQQPRVAVKGKDTQVYVFQTPDGEFTFDKRLVNFIDSGTLHYGEQSYLSGRKVPWIVSVGEDGRINGFVLGMSGAKKLDPQTNYPYGNLKSIANAGKAPYNEGKSPKSVKEDMKNAVTSEEPGGMDQGRENLLPGDTGRRGLPDAGHPSEAQERVHGDRPGGEGNVHPDEGNDGETGAGGTGPDDSLRPEPGGDAGHAGTENGLAVPRVAEGDTGAGVGHADEGGRADVSKPKDKPKPKTNNRHNHQITEDIDSIRPNFNDNVAAIKTMKAILEAGRKATKEEMAVLAKYKGWGALKDILNEYSYYGRQLKGLLTKEEYEAAKLSVLNAHYTSTKVISAMYDAVKRLGFKGGRVLEPSMGTGNFFGTMPKSMARASDLYGVELDSITGNIAKLLYPDAKIDVAGFQDVMYPDGTFDLVIGNVPFSNEIKIPYRGTTYNLHDFFFVKALDETRPGGVVALITSTGTLDKISGKTQRAISDRANLIAAFRLPDNAFKTNAGTEVTTDLLFLQRKGEGIEDNGIAFQKIGEIDGVPINEYFVEHPENILGKLAREKGMYASERTVVHGDGRNMEEALSKAFRKLPKDIMSGEPRPAAKPVTARKRGERSRRGFQISEDGTVTITDTKTGETVEYGNATKKEKEKTDTIREYVGLKETFLDLLNTENSGGDGSALRDKLNEQYDAFVEKHGPLSSKENKRLLGQDGDYIRTTGIELKTKDGYGKSDIFRTATTARAKKTHADTAEEALSISLNETGGVDLARMEKLTGNSREDILKALGDEIILTPDGEYQLTVQYASGDIYEKLDRIKGKKGFEKQRKILEAALPKRKGPDEIMPTIGSHWISPDYVRDFIRETFEVAGGLNVSYSKELGQWSVKLGWTGVKRFSTDRVEAKDIIEKTLNGKNIVVTDKDADGKRVINPNETKLAQAKQDDLRDAFQNWAFADRTRADDLIETYNRTFNNYAPMNYDALADKIDWGVNPASKKQPRDYQKAAAARIVFGGNTLLHNGVGTGKTLTMIIAAHGLKQAGIANKPMFVVPNGKVEDFRTEILEAYPDAKILALDNESMTPKQIQSTKSLIATGDWDYVIIYRSAFGLVPLSPEVAAQSLQRQLELYEAAARENAGDRNGDKRFEKGLKARMETLRNRINALLDKPKDESTFFDDMGIDALFVDEAHNFKKVGFPTTFNFSGIVADTNEMTTDLYMKEEWLRDRGDRIVLATATPITNAISEMYNMTMHVAPEVYRNAGIYSFDTWANTFVNIESQAEIASDGKTFRMKERARNFKNANALFGLYRQFADIKLTQDVVKGLPEAEVVTVTAEGTDLHQQILDYLSGLPKDKILQMNNDGKMAATDLRLASALLDEMGIPMTAEELDLPKSKINLAVGHIVDEWENSAASKGTQFVFLDVGIGQSKTAGRYNYNLYGDLIDKLVKAGIPKKEIAKIGDYDGEEKRQILYDKMNNGEIRVLIGSTAKMGEGVNAQQKAVALHHLSVPYRPDNLEQREGRIVRSGNTNKKVRIYKYIQENSYDSYLWQMIERKAAYLAEAYRGGDATEVDELSEAQVNAREAKAIATGNPLIMEKMNLQDTISRLKTLYRGWQGEKYDAQRTIEQARGKVAGAKQAQANAEADIRTVTEAIKKEGDGFSVTIGKKTFDTRKDATTALNPYFKERKTGKIGTVHGLEFGIQYDPQDNNYRIYVRGEGEYYNSLGDSASGNLTRIVNLAEKGPQSAKTVAERNVQINESAIRDAETTLKAPFKHQKELEKSQARMREIDRELGVSGNDVTIETEETPAPTSGEVQYSREPGSAAGKSKEKKNFNEAQAGIAPRPENWTTERIKGGKTETPMSLSQIISKMMHDFDLNVTFGHVRGKGVRGQFNPRDKGIRSRIEQDLPTISHELGHWLDDRAGITGRKMSGEMRNELEAALGEMKDQYPESAIQSEGFAEFIRKYLTNRETAAIDYPILTETIKRGLDGRDLILLNQFADEINAYYALDANTAGSAIRFREDGRPDYRTHVERVKDLGDSVYQAWVDSNHAIKNLDRITGGNAYIYATNAAYRDNVAAQIIDGDLTDPNGRYVGPGWKTAIQGINTRNKQEWRDFGEYLVVRHGPERLDAGKRVFADDRKNSSAFMNARREELEEKYPAFKAAGDRLIEFERNLVDVWGVGTGLIESSLAESWHELYPNHVPLNRAIPRTRGGSGGKRGYANQSNPLRRAKGSGLDIVHPAENIIDEIVMLVNAGTLNRVMQMVAGEAESMGADAMFMEKVPTPMVAKKFSMTGIKETLDQAGNEARLQGMFSENAQATFDEIVSSLDDVMIQYERGKAHGNVVTVMRNGNPEFWKVNDEALLDSLTHLSAPQIGGILEAYAKTTRFMTANITGNNPIWSLFSNAPRDIMTFFTFSKERNPGKAIPAIGSAYLNAFRQRYKAGEGLDPLFAEYLAMGGGHASAYSADANLAKRARKSAMSNEVQRVLDAINPINWVSFVSDTIEMGPRFATYKMMRQAGMEPNEAFYQAMDVTTNFRKAGYQSRQINKVVPFFNASVQGVDKFARFLSAEDAAPGKRGKTAAGRFTAMVAVSAALAAVLYALNNRDDDRKRDYQQLSTYTKNAYWCIPMEDGKFFTIPKPREIAVMTSLFETILERAKGGNEHAFDEFYDYAVENFLPSVISDLAEIPSNIAREGINEGLKTSFFGAAGSMGLLGVGFYMGANRDFLGRPIESQSLQNMEPRDRFTNSTSKMAYYIGQGLNLSPQMIDYLGNQVLGYVWKVPNALFPVGEDPDFTLGVKATYLKDSEYSTDLVNRLYDRKDRSDRAASSKDDIDIAINAKLDNTMTTFYGRFNKLNRDRDDTNGRRAARQTVLTMIHDYLGQAESGQWPDSMKRVLDAVRRTGSTELMPTALNAYIEDGDSKHNLTDSQYVEYQTMYNGYYYDVAGQAMSGVEPGSNQEAAILRQAKSLAKDKADEAMLKKLGVNPSSGYTEKYPGISDQDIVRFKASLQLANEDGSLTQEEVISVIDDMMRDGLSKGNASTLFHSKYESDKHNKYK